MTLAIVNVFPEPVTPRSVTASEPWFSAEQIPSIADGWSPAGLYAELILNFIVPFSKLFPMSESLQIIQRYAICKKLSSLIPFMSCSSPASDFKPPFRYAGIIVPEKLWTSLIICLFLLAAKGSAIFLCRLFNCET